MIYAGSVSSENLEVPLQASDRLNQLRQSLCPKHVRRIDWTYPYDLESPGVTMVPAVSTWLLGKTPRVGKHFGNPFPNTSSG